MPQWYSVLTDLAPILMGLGAVFVPPWIKSVIRSELKDIQSKVDTMADDIDDADGRIAAFELWQRNVAKDVHSIPATNAVLSRLEKTMTRTDETLSRLNDTIRTVAERVASIEGTR